MSTNPNVKMPITNDLRSKVVQKFHSIHPKLQTATSPEQLEKSCYDKANNDRDTYLKLCNNLVSNRTKQLENSMNNIVNNQVRGVVNANFRPNMVEQINGGVVSDPINALQNLTVTAGQPNQINIQQANQQINYHINPQTMIQMTPNGQMPQRIMVSSNRTIDQFTMQQQQQQMSNSPNPQMLATQIHNINSMNPGNSGNTIRMINKTPTIKQDQIRSNQPMMPATYQIDSNGVLVRAFYNGQMNNPHMTNVMVRPTVNRIVSSSPGMAIQHQSPQEHYALATQIPPTVTLVQNINPQSEMIISNQQNIPQTNIINNNGAMKIIPTTQNTQQTMASSQNATQNATQQTVSQEEAQIVKDELCRLSAAYLRYLQLALANPMNTSPDTLKVWNVLKTLLDPTKPCEKPITLKHVKKIQSFSEMAEQHVLKNNLDPTIAPVNPLPNHTNQIIPNQLPTSDEIFGKRIIPDRNKTAFMSETNIDVGTGPGQPNSLDAAFEEMIHKINKQNPKDKRKVRDNIIKQIKSQYPKFLHFLPYHLKHDTEQMDVPDEDSEYDKHEFDFLDAGEGNNRSEWGKPENRAFDKNGLLRTDIERSQGATDIADVRKEIALLQKEFDVVLLDSQFINTDWVSGDSEWENSVFYSVRYRNEEFPASIPPIFVRIPHDYEESSTVDWNLNSQLYPTGLNSDVNIFLGDIQAALQEEFSNLSSHPWNGVPLLDIIILYKRGIQNGYSNYECRKSIFK